MKTKINLLLFVFMFMGCSTIPSNTFAAGPKQAVENCLKMIKNKEYEKSYEYFSISLKSQVSIENHVVNLKNIENSLGRLINYSDKLPIFRNYFLDENMFSGKNKQTEYRYFLNYEKGSLIAYIEVEQDGSDWKINVFYLDTINK